MYTSVLIINSSTIISKISPLESVYWRAQTPTVVSQTVLSAAIDRPAVLHREKANDFLRRAQPVAMTTDETYLHLMAT